MNPQEDFNAMMAFALEATLQAGQGIAPPPAPAVIVAVATTPQQVVRMTITSCRPPVPPGTPSSYAGPLLDALRHGGSAATTDAGCRTAIDGALADFPPDIRTYVAHNNGRFPPSGTHMVGREAMEVVASTFARRMMRPILMDQVSRLQTTHCTPAALDAILSGLGEIAYLNV